LPLRSFRFRFLSPLVYSHALGLRSAAPYAQPAAPLRFDRFGRFQSNPDKTLGPHSRLFRSCSLSPTFRSLVTSPAINFTMAASNPRRLAVATQNSKFQELVPRHKLNQEETAALEQADRSVNEETLEELDEEKVKHRNGVLRDLIFNIAHEAVENGGNQRVLEGWQEKHKNVYEKSSRTKWAFKEIQRDLKDVLQRTKKYKLKVSIHSTLTPAYQLTILFSA